MHLIRGQNIKKIFKSGDMHQEVLRGITISIAPGEMVAIVGKSGAGKSTLLYQLAALDRPTSGEVFVSETRLQDLSEPELVDFRLYTIGYVFQDYALIPDLSAVENVATPLLMRGTAWDEAYSVARQALGAVGLDDKLNSLPTRLSGGEQQRVSIARAIAGRPKILFADEPTANLDSASGQVVIDLLVKLHQAGQTIVMVTHEPEYAALCSRIVTLEDGLIVSDTCTSRVS